MQSSTITIEVKMDEKKVPNHISWKADNSTMTDPNEAKAMMLAFWDGAEKTALRIDLWTKEMMIDEMADFFYQTLMTMADTFERSTQFGELKDDMKNFSKVFYEKFRALQMKENKL